MIVNFFAALIATSVHSEDLLSLSGIVQSTVALPLGVTCVSHISLLDEATARCVVVAVVRVLWTKADVVRPMTMMLWIARVW